MKFSNIKIDGITMKGAVFQEGRSTIGIEIPSRERPKIKNEGAAYHRIDDILYIITQVRYTAESIIFYGRRPIQAIGYLDTGA